MAWIARLAEIEIETLLVVEKENKNIFISLIILIIL